MREGLAKGESRRAIFAAVWSLAARAAGVDEPLPREALDHRIVPVPFLDEPWYC